MAEIQEYKCPNCGGAVTFDSTLQKMNHKEALAATGIDL